MGTERNAEADLATCDATGDTEWAYEFYSTALPYWLREVERLRLVGEANLAMSADLIAMEGAIKELRHELDRSRNAHGKAELEIARLKQQYAEEVDEFNAGYQAACDGLGEDAEPFHCPYDVWLCGYAWGKFEALKVEVNRLQEANVFALSENARFDVMARLRHAILPEINADSTFFTIGQVRTLVAEIEKLESLVAEANSELAGVTDIYRRAYTAIGACDISNFLAKCEQAAGFEQREHDLESIIKDLRHELDRSRNAHGKAELELARLRTTLASIEEYGTEEINTGIELRQENERLRNIISNMEKDL